MGSAALDQENLHQMLPYSPFKETTSCIHVDSISVDISPGERIETLEGCNHFSIRGYVAEIRKRDKELCFPFCTHNGSNEALINSFELPPLDVPKFRWWECNSCLRHTSQKSGERFNPHHPTCIANSSQRSDMARDLIFPFKDYGQVSMLPAQERKYREPGSSSNSHDLRNQSLLRGSACGKALVYGTKYKFHKQNSRSASGMQLDILLQDLQDDGEVDRKQLNDANKHQLHASAVKGANEAGLVREKTYSGVPVLYPSGVCGPVAFQHRDLQTSRMDAALTKQATNTTRGHFIPLPDLNKCDDGSLEIDEDGPGNNTCDDDEDDLSGGSRPKTRKTRLLSELLDPTEYTHFQNVRKEDMSRLHSSDRSTGKDFLSNDKRLVLVIENGGPHVSGQKKKTTFNGGGHRPVEIKGSGEGAKKLRTCNADKDNTPQSTEDSYTESEQDISIQMITQPVPKRSYNLVKNHEIDKKVKRPRVDSKGSSVFPIQNAPKLSMGKVFSADNHSSAADSSRMMDHLVQSHAITLNMEKRASTVKRKTGNQITRDQTSFVPWKNLALRECSILKHDETQPGKDISSGKAMNTVNSDENELCYPSAPQGLKIVDADPAVRKDLEPNNTRVSRTCFTALALAASTGGNFEVDRETIINERLNLKGKEKMFPEDKTDGLLQSENMVSSDMRKTGMTSEFQGLRQDIDINAIPADDKELEKASSDDIPMDIVELMAKHQHERQRSFERDQQYLYAKRVRTSECNCTNNSYGIRPAGTSNLWQENFLGMQRPSSNAGNGAVAGYDPVSINQKTIGQLPNANKNYINVGYPRGTYPLSRFDGSTRQNEHASRELRLPSLALPSHSWSGRTPAERSTQGSAQGLEPSNRLVPPSQHNLGNKFWASGRQKCTPQGLGNSGIVLQTPNRQKVNQDNELLNLDYVHQGKQLPSWYLTGRPGGAMYLLNAMDSGRRESSSFPYIKDGNPEFIGWAAQCTVKSYVQHAGSQNFRGYNPVANSKNALLVNYGNSLPQKSVRPHYSAMPNAGPFASFFQNKATVGRPADTTNQLTFTARRELSAGNSQMLPQRGHLSWHTLQTFPCSGLAREYVSTVQKGKGILEPSTSAIPPLHLPKDLTSQKNPETRTVLPAHETEACLVNKNPAELDVNLSKKYMIEGEKLRLVKWSEAYFSPEKATLKKAEYTTPYSKQRT